MSWSRPAAALLVALALAGCGFRPLYGDAAAVGAPGVQQRLGDVRILQIADRRGQMLYNALLDRVNPHGAPASPRYTLAVRVRESVSALDTRRDGTVTRSALALNAQFELRDVQNDVIVFRQTASAASAFNLPTQRFAGVVGEDDARRRVVELLADDIVLQLALFVNRRPDAPRASAL